MSIETSKAEAANDAFLAKNGMPPEKNGYNDVTKDDTDISPLANKNQIASYDKYDSPINKYNSRSKRNNDLEMSNIGLMNPNMDSQSTLL